MHEAGLTAIIINSDTVDVACKAKHNIWKEVILAFMMVMVSLEELALRDFNQLLGVKKFWDCIFALGVDKVHIDSRYINNASEVGRPTTKTLYLLNV